jgi:4-amino-4-deoxy-L-arabinose transferase-like glycosyltransferase
MPMGEPASVPPAGVPLRISPRVVWLLAVAVVLVYLLPIGFFPLSEPDEARYGEIAREMVERGDWVTPTCNYVRYFEKPPLVYWLTAATFSVLGLSEFAARMWPALFGLLGIAVAGLLGRAMYGAWVGVVAAAVLAACPYYFGLSQALVLDVPLAALIAVAHGAFWTAYATAVPWQRRAAVLALYVTTALAVLTKGPVAVVLVGGTLASFIALRREWGVLRWLVSPLAVAAFLAVALPWFVLVSLRTPQFVDFFIVKQHLERFAAPTEHRQAAWFFVPIVLGGALPWSAFFIFAPRRPLAALRRLLARRASAATLYCVLWVAVTFVFFSLSRSKLATYVVPLFPPLAILMARGLRDLVAGGVASPLRRGLVLTTAVGVVLLVTAPVVADVVDLWQTPTIVSRMLLGGALVTVLGFTALLLLRRGARAASVAMLVVIMLGFQAVAVSGRTIAPAYDVLGTTIRQYARPGDAVAVYRHYVHGIAYYAQRRVVQVLQRGELSFGGRLEGPNPYFWPSDATLLDHWRSGQRVFLVINRVDLESLAPRLSPAPRQLASEGKKVVVVNFD